MTVFDQQTAMCSSCEGCCQMAWPLPLHRHKYQPLSVSSHRHPEGGCPRVFLLGYMWEVHWLQRDNEVQHQTWLAWTQPEVQKWGLKMSSHTLLEVHYMNNSTPVFSFYFTLVLSLPGISPAVFFLPLACSHSHCAPLSVNKKPWTSFPYPSVYQPVSWGAATMSRREDWSHRAGLWHCVG